MSEDIKGMASIQSMLKKLLEQQEKVFRQVGELTQKVEGVEQQQSTMLQKVEGVEQKVEGVEQKVERIEECQIPNIAGTVNELASRMRLMDWQRLRWRRVEWERIPPDMRVMVIPFLGVEDIMSLNSSISDKKLRKQLKKSYRGALIPAFDKYRFTDKDDFKGLRWVMKAGVDLQGCDLVLHEQGGRAIENADKVLRWLVDNGREDLATVHGMRSGARDMLDRSASIPGEVSTLWLAAERGYVPVVLSLLSRGADIDKACDDGCTPLFAASEKGHVDVVRVLVERGADINKALDSGATPLYTASQKGHVEVVRMLVERGADIKKTYNGVTPLQIATRKNHTEIIHMLELAAQV